jgi:hypothetical protein
VLVASLVLGKELVLWAEVVEVVLNASGCMDIEAVVA